MKARFSIWFLARLAGLALLLLVVVALARDMGPQRVTAVLPGGAGVVTPPTGDTGRFFPTHLVFAAAAGETQTVHYVIGGVTNLAGAKVIATGDAVLTLTNAPPLFSGDLLLVASNATGVTNKVTLIGTLFD